MPRLDGAQAERLRALIAKLDPAQFEVFFARAPMGKPLANVVFVKQPFDAVARDTVEWLEFSDKTFDFLVAFREHKKAVAEIAAFCDPILQQGRDYVPPGPAPLTAAQVNDEIVAFRTIFEQRHDLFQYLDAYKTLHDVIQKLQDQLGALRLTASQYRSTAVPVQFAPVLVSILDDLTDKQLASARRSRPLAEYPDDFDWVDSLAAALDQMRAAVPAANHDEIDAALDALAAIPSRQSELNVVLVRTAEKLLRRWDAPGQVARILSGPAQSGHALLLADLDPFRALCLELNTLTTDHNLCQEIEESLAVADPNSAVATGIVHWNAVYAALLRLAARRQKDVGIARLSEYAHTFAAAVPPQSPGAFVLLRSQFGRQFNQIDDTLITVTRELVRIAARLSRHLRSPA